MFIDGMDELYFNLVSGEAVTFRCQIEVLFGKVEKAPLETLNNDFLGKLILKEKTILENQIHRRKFIKGILASGLVLSSSTMFGLGNFLKKESHV